MPGTSEAPAMIPTGRVGRTGRPLLDARGVLANIDWATLPPPSPDDVGIETADGRRLTTADDVLDHFTPARDRA